MKEGTNAIFFIHPSYAPKHKKVTYAKLVATMRPLKAEVNRARVTLGGDQLDYEGDTSAIPAELQTVKIHLNSVISTPGGRYLNLDIKDFFCGTPMPKKDYEYAQIHLSLTPEETMQQHELRKIAANDRVYFEVRKGMPGLKQASIIANKRLSEHLSKAGYKQSRFTPSLWKHTKLPISFTLVVDDFGVMHKGRKNAQHLIDTLRSLCTISIDWTGSKYLGLDMQWDY